ncbi:hypothetical protein FRC07_009461 [Ceratobasidium sp. 392]|nr:hypothetical protein FRC07_009461 [Ceratobasidium sp. 392]
MSNWPKSSRHPKDPSSQHRISFPSILGNPWYNRQKDYKIKTIQYRKEFRAPFRHEYLVVFLSDGSICRFDRRPDPSVVSLDALRERGSEAYDTVEEITPGMLAGPDIQSTSECLATLTLRDELDLYFIFLVCYGIQSDPQAVRYTLLQYNCYFFSWAIILNIARNFVTWEGLPSFASFKDLPKSVSSELSDMLVHKLLDQSTTICSNLIHQVLDHLAILLPSRLSVQLPQLHVSSQQLPDLLRNAADSRNPLSILRWMILKSRMSRSLEYALTNETFRRKLHKCIRKRIQFSGQLGHPLCNVLNGVLRQALWKHTLNKDIRRATMAFLREKDVYGDRDEYSDESGSIISGSSRRSVEVMGQESSRLPHGASVNAYPPPSISDSAADSHEYRPRIYAAMRSRRRRPSLRVVHKADVPSINHFMWDSVAETISREMILTFQENTLDMFVDLICRVLSGCITQSKPPATLNIKSTRNSLSGLVRDIIYASISDVLRESLLKAVWETAKREKEINRAIAHAIGSVTADLLQDSQLPFALKVRNPSSIKDPLLLKSEIRWHIARWAKKTTAGVDMQVSHSMLEQYFEYRIGAHSRGVRRFDVVNGRKIDIKKELHDAIHRVWRVVLGVQLTDKEPRRT